MANYFLGTIKEVLDPDLYHIKIDIPGLAREVEAFPMRGEIDEPRVGDPVLVRDVDPIYHSIYLYSELKEDKFIGIRSRGKIIKIDEDEIRIGIFDPDEKYEKKEPPIPEITSWIKIDKKGNVEISGERDITVRTSRSATVEANNVTITGGTLNVSGSTPPTGGGPFCAIPVCPLTGAPHIGPRVLGT